MFPSRPRILAPVVSLPDSHHGIRRLSWVSKREAPSPIQCATSMAGPNPRLHLNAFRGEPAISGFAWHFTPIHRSSRSFAIDLGSGLHARVPRASPCPWIAHPVSGRLRATDRPFGLGFPPAPPVAGLTSPHRITRRLILQKARRHPVRRPGSDRPEADGFRISFTPLDGVLFTVPSRYWCTIGRLQYLALGRGRPCFPPDVSCPAVLTLSNHPPAQIVAYGALTRSGPPFQDGSADLTSPGEGSVAPSTARVLPRDSSADWLVRRPGLGSSRFARRYSGNPHFSSRY